MLRRITTATLLTAALAVAATGTGQAEPATPSSNQAGVGFEVKRVGNTVVATLDNGRFELAGNSDAVVVKDRSGASIDSMPLSYTLDGRRYPVLREISGDKHTVKLTPVTDRAQATPAGAVTPRHDVPNSTVRLQPVASDQENSRAQTNFLNQLAIATSIGTIVGTIIGAVVGGGVGAVVALASCAALLACLVIGAPIFVTLASAGAIVGTAIGGGGALLTAGWDYLQTLQAAPGTTHYQAQIDRELAQTRHR